MWYLLTQHQVEYQLSVLIQSVKRMYCCVNEYFFTIHTADQVYGDQEMHSVVRNHCMDYMVSSLRLTNTVLLFKHDIGRKDLLFQIVSLLHSSRMQTTSLSSSLRRISSTTSTGKDQTSVTGTTLRCRPLLRCTTGL